MLTFSRKNAWIFAGVVILTASQIAFAQNVPPAVTAAQSTDAVKAGTDKTAAKAAADKKAAKSKAEKAAKSKAEKVAADKKLADKKPGDKKVSDKKAAGKTAPEKNSGDKTRADTKNSGKKAPESKAARVTPPRTVAPAAAEKPAAAQDAPEEKQTAEKPAADAVAKTSAAASPEEAKGWKRVKVPLPPVLNRQLRIAAAKADAEKEKAGTKTAAAEPTGKEATGREPKGKSDSARLGRKAPEIQPVAPPEPRRTGIFALFESAGTAQSQDDNNPARQIPGSASSFARVEGPATKLASLTMPNPLRSRKPNRNSQDDDLEDEEDNGRSGVGVGGGFGSGHAGIEKQIASVQTACLNPRLVAMIQQAGRHFGGTPVVTSGYRGRGRRGSYHRKCAAADFQIPGVTPSQIVSYLRALPGAGGVGTYCHTKSVHLDTGQPRDWHQCLFTRRFALRAPVVTAGQ